MHIYLDEGTGQIFRFQNMKPMDLSIAITFFSKLSVYMKCMDLTFYRRTQKRRRNFIYTTNLDCNLIHNNKNKNKFNVAPWCINKNVYITT